MHIDELPAEIRDSYTLLKVLPDGRICGVHQLLFHWTLHVDLDLIGYAERYCYSTKEGAIKALTEWDGKGDPQGWHRHPESGRRRDLVTGREWIAW